MIHDNKYLKTVYETITIKLLNINNSINKIDTLSK